MRKILCVIAIALSLPGCFTTSLMTSAPAGPAQSEKQWFLFWGATRISADAARECGAAGVAWSESKQDFSDLLISFGLAAATGYALSRSCNQGDTGCITSMASLGSSASTILATRTVEYACRVDSGAGIYTPPPKRTAAPKKAAAPVEPVEETPTDEGTAASAKSTGAKKAPQGTTKPAKAADTAPPVAPAKSAHLSDEDCFDSEQCQKFGRCSTDGTKCVAANNASCRQSLNCQVLKKCTARDGDCVK